jgi:predicted RND superfamily exporter protein
MSSSRWSGKQLANLPLYLLGGVIGLTAVVFLASWVVMDGGFQRAWEILLGLRSPYGQASGLGVVLSALGYIAVPTVIGIGIADGVTRFTRRRLLTRSDVEDAATEIVKKELKKVEKPGA